MRSYFCAAPKHPRLLCRKRFCCPASAFPGQHLVLLSSIRGCCAGNGFAVRHRRFLDSIGVCCLASAVAVSGNGFAVRHRHFLDSIGVCRLASAFAIQETVLLSSIGVSCPASSTPISKPTTTYMLCTTTYGLRSSPFFHASKFVTY